MKIFIISLLEYIEKLFIVTVEYKDTVKNFDSFAINFPALQQWNERKTSVQYHKDTFIVVKKHSDTIVKNIMKFHYN